MIEGIDVTQRIEFSSAKDTAEPKTIFVFRPLNREEQGGMSKLNMYDMLATCIVEIKNFNIKGTIREQLVSIKDNDVLIELIEKIGSINKITAVDQKN